MTFFKRDSNGVVIANRRIGKRGSLSDLIYIMVIFMVLGIVIIVGKQIYLDINSSGFMDDQPRAKNIADNWGNSVLPLFDTIFLAVVVAGFLGTLFLAFQLRTSPLFFWIGFLFLVIVVMLSAIFSNVYQEVADSGAFAEALSSDVTFLETVMDFLPIIITVIGAVTLIVLYGLSRYQQEML